MNEGYFVHKNIFARALRHERVTSSCDTDCLEVGHLKGMTRNDWTINLYCRKSQAVATLAKFKICWGVEAEDVLKHIGTKVTTEQEIYYFHFTGQS